MSEELRKDSVLREHGHKSIDEDVGMLPLVSRRRISFQNST